MLYSERQIGLIRDAGKVVADCHEIVREMMAPGCTTRAIDEAVAAETKRRGGVSPFYGYQLPGKVPFPCHVCSSPNDIVVHGIADDTPFKEGDLIAIDIGVRLNGYIGDSAWTYPVGQVDETALKLLKVGEDSLYRGIAAMKPRGKLVELSRAIQREIEGNGFSVVREYVGHGVGQSLHEEPQVPNYVQTSQMLPFGRVTLKPGMVLAVEPMVNEGTAAVISDEKSWVVRTADGGRSVHFEHTVAVLEDRVEILTLKSWDTWPRTFE